MTSLQAPINRRSRASSIVIKWIHDLGFEIRHVTKLIPVLRLRELFDKEGTDKGNYARVYEILLQDRRLEIRTLLEIGIGSLLPSPSSMSGYVNQSYRPGASLRAWKAYFPNAQVVGIDIQPDTQFEEERIKTYLCDSTDFESVRRLGEQLPASAIQVIIDDASHDGSDQLKTLKHFWPLLEDGGFYFIEDIAPATLLFDKPASIEPIVGRSNYFSVIDSAPVKASPIRRLLRLPRIEEWKLLVIRKDRTLC
jgi:hypothetical protein